MNKLPIQLANLRVHMKKLSLPLSQLNRMLGQR
ncbi:Uncharacterised protein [Mycobacteroides abscessus subsp. abscessus]|nr:Uncharacterised protein [Mycobacteroides abscessus subsp. abscessus]